MNIEVNHKSRYGKDSFYPISEDAKFLSQVIGKKGFMLKHLTLFKNRGWSVVITAIPQSLEEYLKVS
jgi:hypothetical protein